MRKQIEAVLAGQSRVHGTVRTSPRHLYIQQLNEASRVKLDTIRSSCHSGGVRTGDSGRSSVKVATLKMRPDRTLTLTTCHTRTQAIEGGT